MNNFNIGAITRNEFSKLKERIIFNGNLIAAEIVAAGAAVVTSAAAKNAGGSGLAISAASVGGEGLGFYGTAIALFYLDDKKRRERENISFKQETVDFTVKSTACALIYTPLRIGLDCWLMKKGIDEKTASVVSQGIALVPYFYLMNKWRDKPVIPEPVKRAYGKAYVAAANLSVILPKG